MADAASSQGDTGKAGVSGKAVAAGLGAAAAVAVGAAAAAGKKQTTDDASDDTAGMDVGVPLEATPTQTVLVETEPPVQEGVGFGGGAPATDAYADRDGNAAYPPDNTFGQPTDPDRV